MTLLAGSFARSSLAYLAGTVFSRLTVFFLIPLYTRYISPADYGFYDVTLAYLNLFTSVLFLDIWATVLRFMFDHSDRSEKYSAVSSGLVILSGSFCLYGVCGILLFCYCDIPYLGLLLLYGFACCWQNFYAYVTRGFGENVLFALSGMVSSFTTAAASIFFLAGLKLGYDSLYMAMLLGLTGQILLLERKLALRRHVGWRRSCPLEIRAMLSFALPLCLNSLGYWFLTDYNRTVIFHKLSPEANGLFSLAGKFSLALLLVSSCFQLAWQETAFAKCGAISSTKTELARTLGPFYSKAGAFFLLSLFCCGSVWLSFVSLGFPFLVDGAYEAARSLIPLYVAAVLASIYSLFLGTIFTALKATRFLFVSTLCACLVNVILLQALLDSLGVLAAPLALLCGYLTSAFLRFWRLKQTIRYGDWRKSSLAALALFGLAAYIFLQGTYEASGFCFLGELSFAFCLLRRKVFGLLAKVRGVNFEN